jgi:hypothetical protein
MTGEPKVKSQDHHDPEPERDEEADEAPPEEHNSDCWRYSRCWCDVDEDQFAPQFGRGER